MCVLMLGTRLVKDIPKVRCELSMAPSDFFFLFLKGQDLLVTERGFGDARQTFF